MLLKPLTSSSCASIAILFLAVVVIGVVAAAPPHQYPTLGPAVTTADNLAVPDLVDLSGSHITAPVDAPQDISSPFGPRWKASQSRDDFHRGIDFYGADGVPIYAIQDGTVFQIHTEAGGTMSGGGNVIIIEHTITKEYGNATFQNRKLTGGKYFSYYLHLQSSTASLTVGGAVTKGQEIGKMGQTGETTFTHLHFETRLQGYCSYQYQVANSRVPSATSSCNTGFDPHVNPYYFIGNTGAIGAANSNNVKSMETISPMPGHTFALRYNTTRSHMDIDVIASDQGRVGLNTRVGMKDISTIEALDDLGNITSYMSLRPGYFISTTANSISYELHFKRIPRWVGVYDMYGKGIKFTNPVDPAPPLSNATTSSSSALTTAVSMLVMVLLAIVLS